LNRTLEIFTSGLVGALALAVSTYNVYLQRAQVRAEVWPHLEWMYSDEDGFTWLLTNVGVGPALLQGVRITVDGAPMKTWDEAFRALAKTEPALLPLIEGTVPDVTGSRMSIAGVVLGAGVQKRPMGFHGHLAPETRAALRHAYGRMEAELCYCSTLGDCWVYPGHDQVKVCDAGRYTFAD
jgi:hypothetical protein